MIDTSNFTLDTSIKISIMDSGIYVPELSTYTPLECYASIDECIAIMNRGIEINFPQQEKREISEKIEDMLLEYEEKKQKIKKSYGSVGTNVDKALNVIQTINESAMTKEEIEEEQDAHIFNYEDITDRIVQNLKYNDDLFQMSRIFNENNNVDIISEEEKLRKSRKRNEIRKKEALEMLTLETETFNRLANAGQFEKAFDEKFDSLDYYDTTPNVKR